jgi:glycosyltransferase involved in cell wall biosynthesis
MSEKTRCDNNSNVVVITSGADLGTPNQKSFIKINFLPKFIKVLLGAYSGTIYVIVSRVPYSKKYFHERVQIKQIMSENETGKLRSSWSRIVKYILTQLKISYVLAKERKAEAYIFFLAQPLTLPILTLKILRRKIIIVTGASCSEIAKFGKDYLLLIQKIEEKINYPLSDQIIVDINVESENLIHQFGLEKYRNKISFGGALPVDVNSFRIKKKLRDRRNIIGCIGRLVPQKGVMNFAKAIPLILKERNDLEFLIGGGGILFEEIEDELKANGSYDKVTLTGGIPYEKLPDYYNEMKLFVDPTYTETIPTVIMEAMACGTPIVASPVDAIPDLIKDGENGFLMENNSPECIAKNVIKALDDPRLDEIVKNANDLINREYTYEKVVENYRKLLMIKK